ncbi:unnamed protein product [Vitrella brassicaformis CCMP3155]|uniref:Uncharacterized protein n=2 Tax=Vitrella brassicaformis TaxID=1169539 RepID=A0A0G4EPH6_VITBC|nr:unnamed protein product [Vitrella brassicaformis CCMP3155]|mmetsp:Transcript_8436/g.20667  ORF Transcript_8436/g.20667 Transcript_8436/m.20667 type:complete len:167 (+) Transcript_8436:106-606(+)|eukprot:CEL99366.1 unnamed protein product [Vitrella brassicaformis CCMP3155]
MGNAADRMEVLRDVQQMADGVVSGVMSLVSSCSCANIALDVGEEFRPLRVPPNTCTLPPPSNAGRFPDFQSRPVSQRDLNKTNNTTSTTAATLQGPSGGPPFPPSLPPAHAAEERTVMYTPRAGTGTLSNAGDFSTPMAHREAIDLENAHLWTPNRTVKVLEKMSA